MSNQDGNRARSDKSPTAAGFQLSDHVDGQTLLSYRQFPVVFAVVITVPMAALASYALVHNDQMSHYLLVVPIAWLAVVVVAVRCGPLLHSRDAVVLTEDAVHIYDTAFAGESFAVPLDLIAMVRVRSDTDREGDRIDHLELQARVPYVGLCPDEYGLETYGCLTLRADGVSCVFSPSVITPSVAESADSIRHALAQR